MSNTQEAVSTITRAASEGVEISLKPDGSLLVRGEGEALEKYRPIIGASEHTIAEAIIIMGTLALARDGHLDSQETSIIWKVAEAVLAGRNLAELRVEEAEAAG